MTFDVFISHNSSDKFMVRRLARAIEAYNLSVWLDEEQLRPGMPWQDLLEHGVHNSKTIIVAVGSDGLGPWENQEMQSALRLSVKDNRPTIPVLLPDAGTAPELPLFLGNRTWVDLREGLSENGIKKLIWGITGEKPTASLTVDFQTRVYEPAHLEEIFTTSGLPPYTYVVPEIYRRVASDIKKNGKHVLLAGPSGSGKTCMVFRILDELELTIKNEDFLYQSSIDDSSGENAQRHLHAALKGASPRVVVIDDFHS